MRTSRFTEGKIIGMIKEQEAGLSTAEVCRKHGLAQSRARRERPPDHAEIPEEMREIAAMRRRFGWRLVGVTRRQLWPTTS